MGAASLAATFLAGGAAYAQAVNYPVGAVVQSLREDPGSALARHLRDLNTSPRSLSSLLGAGNAALEVGDPQTALGMFARAEEVAPRDGRVKAGMGSAFVQNEQAQAALKFFGEAAALGAPLSLIQKDRGLAYDMVGDPVRAQADYKAALQRGIDAEVERRLALSRAIGGDRQGALAVLDRQLKLHDRAGWRARAFVLALTGDASGASKAVEAVLPAQAGALRPFLARLPQLGPVDRAMAVHFGRFPRDGQNSYAANQQSVYVPSYVPSQAAPKPVAVPTGAGRPNGGQTPLSSARRAPNGPIMRYPAPHQNEPKPARTEQPATATLSTALPMTRPAQVPAAQPNISAPVVQTQPVPAADTPAVAQQPVATAQLAPSAVAVDQPGPSPAAQATAEPISQSAKPTETAANEVDFSDVIAAVQSLPGGIDISATEKSPQLTEQLPEAKKPAPKAAAAKPAAPKIAEKKAEPKKTEPAAPKEPSRIWVQLAAAQDKDAFPAEFKRLKAKAGKALASQSAWTTPLKATNRLLVGPFKTEQEARDLVNLLSKVQISSYSWVSEAGQKIDKLSAK